MYHAFMLQSRRLRCSDVIPIPHTDLNIYTATHSAPGLSIGTHLWNDFMSVKNDCTNINNKN